MTAPANRNELMKTDEKENSSPEKMNQMYELYIQLRRHKYSSAFCSF